MASTLPVLTFHAVDDEQSEISYAPDVFRHAIATLAAHGYRALRLTDAVAAVRARRPFPDRAFVLTFDDGFQSVYTAAFPVLRRHGMSATVFLTVGADHAERLPAFEGRTMLSWAEIREMAGAGLDFGAHTLTHPDLTRLGPDDVAREVRGSQERIEQMLGVAVENFAYPFGRSDAQSRGIVERYFRSACSDALGVLTAGSDPYALERVDAYYLRTPRLLALMLSDIFPWYVRARNVPRWLRRAIRARPPRLTGRR